MWYFFFHEPVFFFSSFFFLWTDQTPFHHRQHRPQEDIPGEMQDAEGWQLHHKMK